MVGLRRKCVMLENPDLELDGDEDIDEEGGDEYGETFPSPPIRHRRGSSLTSEGISYSVFSSLFRYPNGIAVPVMQTLVRRSSHFSTENLSCPSSRRDSEETSVNKVALEILRPISEIVGKQAPLAVSEDIPSTSSSESNDEEEHSHSPWKELESLQKPLLEVSEIHEDDDSTSENRQTSVEKEDDHLSVEQHSPSSEKSSTPSRRNITSYLSKVVRQRKTSTPNHDKDKEEQKIRVSKYSRLSAQLKRKIFATRQVPQSSRDSSGSDSAIATGFGTFRSRHSSTGTNLTVDPPPSRSFHGLKGKQMFRVAVLKVMDDIELQKAQEETQAKVADPIRALKVNHPGLSEEYLKTLYEYGMVNPAEENRKSERRFDWVKLVAELRTAARRLMQKQKLPPPMGPRGCAKNGNGGKDGAQAIVTRVTTSSTELLRSITYLRQQSTVVTTPEVPVVALVHSATEPCLQ